MGVLIEAISVVIRKETLESKYRGGFLQYRQDCPNASLCADDYLVRVGFMSPADVGRFISELEHHNFVFQRKGKCIDIAVVDQLKGFTVSCDWLSFCRHPKGFVYCSLNETDPDDPVAVPDGWIFESSISSNFKFLPSEEVETKLQFLRHENGLDVCLDLETGEEVYSGRLVDDQSMTAMEDFYNRGVELVMPYISLVGAKPKNSKTKKARKDLSKGTEYLESVVKMEPAHWPACWLLGKTFQVSGEHENAYQYFKSAYAINPNHIDVCRELALESMELGQTHEAVLACFAAVGIQPGDPGLLSNLGLALLLNAQLSEARKAVEESLRLDPTDEITKTTLAFISQVELGTRPQPRKFSDLNCD